MAVRGPPAGGIRFEPKMGPAWGGGGTVGRVNAWWSFYMHGCPTMIAALAAASSRQTSDVTLWVGGGAVQAVRRLVSDTGGEEASVPAMEVSLHEAAESGDVTETVGPLQSYRAACDTALQSYRTACATPWGCSLPEPFMRDLLHRLKAQRGWQGSRFRLVCAGWRSAHDSHCTRLKRFSLHTTPALLPPSLARVTAVEAVALKEGELAAHLPKFRALPLLTNLKITIGSSASAADAMALGAISTLTTLTLSRNIVLKLSHDGEGKRFKDVYPEGDGDDFECFDECRGMGMYDYDSAEDLAKFSQHLDSLASRAKQARWLSLAVSSLPRLTALDLGKCGNVRIGELAALSALSSLSSLALRGQSRMIYQCGEPVDEGTVDTLRGEDLVAGRKPVLSGLKLTTLELVDMAVSDQALSQLAMLPTLKSLHLVGCDQVTRAGILAAQQAAPPQLKITFKIVL
jgi:hypothetical protein